MSQPAETRDGKVRVPDPDTMGIRVNGPADGWLTDPSNQIGAHQFGDYAQSAGIGTTSYWVGGDHGWGTIGPGSWSGDQSRPWWASPANGGRLSASGSRLTAVERATAVLRNPIITTPWVSERVDGTRLALPLWITDPMLCGRSPGTVYPIHAAPRRLTPAAFWSTLLTHAIWWQLGAFACQENAAGEPLAGTLRILNPFMVVDLGNRWVISPGLDGEVVTDYDGRFDIGGRTWRLVVVRGLPPHDEDIPQGVLARHFDTLRMATLVNGYVESMFRSGVPSGFLKVSTPNIQKDAIEKLRADWEAAHGTGRRSTAVLNATVDYTPIAIKPVDAQAAEIEAHAAMQIAWAFTLDAVWLNQGTSGMSYNNQSDRRADLVSISCAPLGANLLQSLSALQPFGTALRVDWKRFAAPPLPVAAPPVIALHQAGLVSRDEARVELGFLPEESYVPEV